MATVIVPFRGGAPKQRLARVGDAARVRLAHAMLTDVVAAASGVGSALVVTADGMRHALPGSPLLIADPGRGQGAAVTAGLEAATAAGLPTPYLVVNADLPCVTPRDLLALAGAAPPDGLALAAASDGTTNALALADGRIFEPLYGPGSAARFEALAPCRRLDAPNLVDDVDTLDDLLRVAARVGRNTRRALRELHGRAAA